MINYYIYNQKKYLQMIRNKAGFFMGERERERENEREGGGREGALPTVDIVKGWWQQQYIGYIRRTELYLFSNI